MALKDHPKYENNPLGERLSSKMPPSETLKRFLGIKRAEVELLMYIISKTNLGVIYLDYEATAKIMDISERYFYMLIEKLISKRLLARSMKHKIYHVHPQFADGTYTITINL
jgi:predicted transcriptional regulator